MKYRFSPRDFPRAQAIFHRIPPLSSQYSHSQLPLLVNIFITLGHFSFEYGNFWCFGEVLFPPFSLLTKIKCVLLNGRIP